jgi:hypothetical protein
MTGFLGSGRCSPALGPRVYHETPADLGVATLLADVPGLDRQAAATV